jgi:hypothetical protein
MPRAAMHLNPYWFVVGFTLLTQLFIFLRWLHRRLRDSEIERAFVRDMATNHLPHIYHALELIAARLHIHIDEPPPLRFVDLDERPNGELRHR